MNEFPLIYSAPMVRAVLEGRKTMTRRLPTPMWRRIEVGDRLWVREMWRVSKRYDAVKPRDLAPRKMTVAFAAGGSIANHAPGEWAASPDTMEGAWLGKWRPSIFLPRWASRITLEMTAVKVERLNDISDEDARAEGVMIRSVTASVCQYHVPGIAHPNPDFPYLSRTTPREMFAALWDVIHGSGAWLQNPEVVALSFRVLEGSN